MSEVIKALRHGRACAWASLQPAFDRAITLASEAEYLAERASNEALANISPAYLPFVLDLARAGNFEPVEVVS